jgi:hypothetical protein
MFPEKARYKLAGLRPRCDQRDLRARGREEAKLPAPSPRRDEEGAGCDAAGWPLEVVGRSCGAVRRVL